MEQNQTVLEPTPAPKAPDRKQKKSPKKLTKEQRWWRFHGMQAGLFAGMGVVGGGILIALICLLTLPFRGITDQFPGRSIQRRAAGERTGARCGDAYPNTYAPGIHRIADGRGRQPDSQHRL